MGKHKFVGISGVGISWIEGAHLSKHLNDLKQNSTKDKTPFSGTVFNTLSHGGVRFVASGSSKKPSFLTTISS